MVMTIGRDYFIPNGDLIEESKDNKKIKKRWLQSNNPGPYLNGIETPFYYLGGELVDHRYRAQVCAGPPNVVSYNCLDSTTMWVLE